MESLEIGEPADDTSAGRARTTITLKLLNARQDGWITLTYSDVPTHALTCYQCDQGAGEWLRDEFAVGEPGLITHRITWRTVTGATNQWLIAAREITHTWTPRKP